MTIHTNGASDSGGWGYNEVPREEFDEELAASADRHGRTDL